MVARKQTDGEQGVGDKIHPSKDASSDIFSLARPHLQHFHLLPITPSNYKSTCRFIHRDLLTNYFPKCSFWGDILYPGLKIKSETLKLIKVYVSISPFCHRENIMGYTYTNLDSIGLSLLWLFDTIHTL
jgi:hypothetical protein